MTVAAAMAWLKVAPVVVSHRLAIPLCPTPYPYALLSHGPRYAQKKVNDQINTIVDSCLKELQSLNRPFKYIVTCVIMQKNGAGMNTAATMFWDSSKDGRCVVPWTNKTMHVIVTVYGCAVNIDNAAELD